MGLKAQTDQVKLYRIAQNLLHNVLKYSSSGVVSICWSRETSLRWILSVQDLGPGLPAGLVRLFACQLKPTVEPNDEPIELPATITTSRADTHGDGLGIHIVKRLCELLDANVDIETRPDRGTLFRIRLSTPEIDG